MEVNQDNTKEISCQEKRNGRGLSWNLQYKVTQYWYASIHY